MNVAMEHQGARLDVARPPETGPSVVRVRDPQWWVKEDHHDGETKAYA